MSFPRYPAYKDSGVPWMTEVPIHWEVIPAKKGIDVLTDFTANGSFASLAENVEYKSEGFARLIRMTDLRTGLQSEGIWIDEQAYNYLSKSALKGGELLMASVGSVGLVYLMPSVSYKASLAPNMYLIKPNDRLLSKFLYWSLLSQSGQDQLMQAATTTAQPKLNKDNVKSLWLSLPEQSEQVAIVDFLDRETTKIDALVAEQEQLITLLKEKRQAVISHAVTKGLDPSVPMKDSGVEWLGEVPAHWSVQPLGTLTRSIQTGPFGSQLHSDEYVDDATPVINPSNIIDSQLCPEPSATVTDEVVERLAHHKLFEGDIVVGRRGEMGRCAVVMQHHVGWLCGTGCLKIQLNPTAFPEFVWRYLSTEIVKQYLSLQSVGSTMENLNTQILARVPVPIPPASEQAAICKAVSDELIFMTALESEAIAGVQLLQERRSALISAAVTGQIDVRGLVTAKEAA